MTFSKTLKTTLLTLLIAFAMFFMQNPVALTGLAASASSIDNAYKLAVPTEAQSDVSAKVSNNNFTSTGSTTSSYIYAPTSWTLGSNDDLKSLKYGVINLDELETRYEKFGFTKDNKPLSTDASENKVLMINSDASSGAKLNYSQSISLEANSFYRIAVNAYTSSDAFAGIYVDSSNLDTKSAKFESINTSTAWDTYYIYIATSQYQSSTVTLNLYLGNKNLISTGYVLFDNIRVTQFSENIFDAKTTTLPANAVIADNRVAPITDPTIDGYVDSNISHWTRESSDGTVYMEQADKAYSGSNGKLAGIYPATNLSSTTNYSGIALSSEDGYISYKSPDIKIARNGQYKISFYAKGNITSGTMNAVLSGEIYNTPSDEDNKVMSTSLTNLSTATNKFTNDWVLYSFYVSGNSLYDTTVNLYLGLGSESTIATGYIVYGYINSYKLTKEQYTNGQQVGATSTLSMSASNSLSFSNSAFNSVTANDDSSRPDTPSDWTHFSENAGESIVSGVVNTLSTNFANYTSLGTEVANPMTKYGDYTNNALVLRNISKTYQGYYCSNSYTISADSYYLITLDINLQKDLLGESTSGAYIYIRDTNGNNIAWFRYAGNSTDEWQTLKIYIHGAFQDRSITPYLYLGNENNPTTGVVFFDNCKITSSTKEVFETITSGATTKVIDFENDIFSLYDDVENKIYTPSLWKVTNGDTSQITTKMGIIKNNNLPSFITTKPSEANDDMLMIGSTNEAYYSYQSKFDYSLSATTYYKITIDVKTALLQHTIDTDTENENTKYGASITLSGVEKAIISDINTQRIDAQTLDQALNLSYNTFVTYTFYLYPTEATNVSVILSLGSEDKNCSGYAFFKNLKVTQIDQDTYDGDIALLTNSSKNALPSTVLDLVDVESTDDDTEKETYSANNEWWASVFTIIIALAVIVAVIGFAVKTINSRRKETTTVSTNYDRLQTLLKDVDRRNKLSDINTKIRNLQEELKQSEKFLAEEKETLEKESTQYETAKEIANDTGIAIDSPEKKLKAMQDNITDIEEKISGIKLDIQVLEEEKDRIKKQEKKDIQKSSKQKVIIKNRK